MPAARSNAEQVKATFELALLNRGGDHTFWLHETFHTFSISGDCCCSVGQWLPKPLLEDDSFQVRCDVTVVNDFPAVHHNRRLGNLLLANKVGADVTFEVGGELVAAHRCVFAARSTVFMAELSGTATHPVRINDMEPKVFKGLLHFVYTDSLPEVNKGDDKVAMARGLLVAADRYGMERLKRICGDVLSIYVDANTAVATLELAVKHGCHGLKEVCTKILNDLIAKVAP